MRCERFEMSILVIHTPQLGEGVSGHIEGMHVRHEQYTASPSNEAMVEFVVLISDKLLIEKTNGFEELFLEATTPHSIHPFRRRKSDLVIGRSDTERV